MGLRALLFIILSIGLMILNHQTEYFQNLRSQINVVVLPLQAIVDRPMQFFYWAQNSFSSQQVVLEENARLRARQLLLQAKLQTLLSLKRENAQLRELLSSSTRFADTKMLVAQLMATAVDPMTQEVILDRGSRDGVFVGQPVLDAYGVLGQVIDVGPFTSRVLLVTDGRNVVPSQNNRNGLRANVTGTGYSDELIALHLPSTADVVVGDVFISSGLGGRFPFGYPVGRVTSIKKESGQRFAVITLEPSAHVDKSRLVLLIWPTEDQRQEDATAVINDAGKPTKKQKSADNSSTNKPNYRSAIQSESDYIKAE